MKHLDFLLEGAGSSKKGDRNIQNYVSKNEYIYEKRVYVALSIAIVIMSAGYNIYQNQKAETTLSDLTLANVEALADTGEGGGETVKCYCRASDGRYVCSALGNLAYCGADPCSNHDGNCR